MFKHISILHTFNINGLNEYLLSELREENIDDIEIHIGEYNSLGETAIQFKSLYDELPITFILLTQEDLSRLAGASSLNYKDSIKRIRDFLGHQLPIICEYSKAVFIIEPISVLESPNFSNHMRAVELKAYLNSYFINLQENYSNLRFFPLPSDLLVKIDPRYYYYGSLPLGVKTGELISKCIMKIILNYIREKPKIVVFDLDNTIWGGVIGEDGIDGIQIGDNFPGNVYRDIQNSLMRLHKYGVLLIAISKNSLEDAQLGLRHPEGIIREDKLLALSASWGAKHESLVEILKEHNLSQNGIYFLDDSEIEREEMAISNINLTILNEDSSPVILLQSLLDLESDIHHSLTSGDILRANSYLGLKEANETRSKFSSKEDFLRSLKLKLKSKSLNPNNLKRAHQLINKTNQFNLTGVRLTINQLQARMNSDKFKYIVFSLEDIYTHHGEIALIGLHFNKLNIEIVHFLVSCRVLGRGIEYSLFNYVIDLIKDLPFEFLLSYYEIKNISEPASEFYLNAGMKITQRTKQRIKFNARIREYNKKETKCIEIENSQ
tara:strand:- start:2070 stop:3722 length:1653 start_codon:yes stop_codon:yes gene_type:complete